eukprot:gene572-biopygen6140
MRDVSRWGQAASSAAVPPKQVQRRGWVVECRRTLAHGQPRATAGSGSPEQLPGVGPRADASGKDNGDGELFGGAPGTRDRRETVARPTRARCIIPFIFIEQDARPTRVRREIPELPLSWDLRGTLGRGDGRDFRPPCITSDNTRGDAFLYPIPIPMRGGWCGSGGCAARAGTSVSGMMPGSGGVGAAAAAAAPCTGLASPAAPRLRGDSVSAPGCLCRFAAAARRALISRTPRAFASPTVSGLPAHVWTRNDSCTASACYGSVPGAAWRLAAAAAVVAAIVVTVAAAVVAAAVAALAAAAAAVAAAAVGVVAAAPAAAAAPAVASWSATPRKELAAMLQHTIQMGERAPHASTIVCPIAAPPKHVEPTAHVDFLLVPQPTWSSRKMQRIRTASSKRTETHLGWIRSGRAVSGRPGYVGCIVHGGGGTRARVCTHCWMVHPGSE